MGNVWVLDTETKGTGANVAPLERAGGGGSGGQRLLVAPERVPEPAAEPHPAGPRRFKVVDVLTRRVLAEGADARTTVKLLEGIRSVVDVSVYVWEPRAGEWQQLTQGEKAKLWAFRGR